MIKSFFISLFSYSLFLNFIAFNLYAQEIGKQVPKVLQESDINVQLNTESPVGNSNTNTNSFLEVIFFLILIVLAIYLLIRFLKKMSFRAGQRGELLQLLGMEQLPGGLFFHLVALDKKIYLFAGQQGKTQLIDTFVDAEECDRLKLIASQQKKMNKPFSQFFMRRH